MLTPTLWCYTGLPTQVKLRWPTVTVSGSHVGAASLSFLLLFESCQLAASLIIITTASLSKVVHHRRSRLINISVISETEKSVFRKNSALWLKSISGLILKGQAAVKLSFFNFCDPLGNFQHPAAENTSWLEWLDLSQRGYTVPRETMSEPLQCLCLCLWAEKKC